MPETRIRKPGRIIRDRDFENLLRTASRRLNSHPLKLKKIGRQDLKSLFFAA